MDRIRITGGNALKGNIPVSGAKNAALPLLCASLLTKEAVTFTNVPGLADIAAMTALLEQHGANLEQQTEQLRVQVKNVENHEAPYDLVRKMRASILVLGPLLAREGKARVSLPGGCAIGARPVDLHIQALEALGAQISLNTGYLEARAPRGGLKGGHIIFPTTSVGASENAIMAATLARGTTTITGVAQEPEITDLCNLLVSMGAQIEGIGSSRLIIEGQESLHSAKHAVIADRIEAGTFAMSVAMTGGNVLLEKARLEHLEALEHVMTQAGVVIFQDENGVRVSRDKNQPLYPVDVTTAPYPGFATDLQAQMMSMMCCADGSARITETIFENRFMHVPELLRMGADISVTGRTAVIRGVKKLTGASVMATDLRASMSLVMAGLVAEGDTLVKRIYHLDRGYENLEHKLARVGAIINREKDED